MGINAFLLVRDDFHPDFKNLIKKAEEQKQIKKEQQQKDNSPLQQSTRSRSLTDVNQFKSGLFVLTSKLNQLSKLNNGAPLSEDQKNKLMAMYDSIEDPNQLEKATKKDNKDKSLGSETDVRPCSSAISISDIIQSKYILNLSEIQFSK